ncbi:response regulator [Anaerocolumna jejuensis]|uniref:response regulator n=1 Tax=Anaerocolumna jejuensis TaxID=259063 RepID=UPI003F7C5E3D
MYKILVVEDEPAIAQGIQLMIMKGLPEYDVVDLAYDGIEGYEKALNLKPDIILTDICMIQMDGITMISRLKDVDFKGRFIILSGFADFKYAKSAISLGVDDYITKPIEEEELYEVLRKVCFSIKTEIEKKQTVKNLEFKVENYSRNMKEYVLKEVMDFDGGCTEERKLQLSQLGFPIAWKNYICVMLDINGLDGKSIREEIFLLTEELIKKQLELPGERVLIRYSDTRIALVIALNESIDYRKIIGRIGIIRLELSDRTKMQVSVGIGLPHKDIKGLRKSFVEASIALNYKVIKGLNSIIVYDEIKNIDGKTAFVDQEDIKCLEECMDLVDNEGCVRIVEKIFKKIEKDQDLSLEDLQLLSLNLILSGSRKMPFMQFQMNEFLGRNILSLESISNFKTIEQLKNWIINILKGMNELMLKQNIPEKRDVVEEVKKYLSKNFASDIKLTDISEKFFINPFYFSQLFKKRTGDTYQNYLTNLRINRAKKLLEETDLKIFEICEMVGYTDTNHFNKVFERIIGIRPSEYKKIL